jgi:choline dehydrogenase
LNLDAQLLDIVNTLATSGPSVDDINSAANADAVGVGIPSYTIDESHNRSSVHDHLVRVKESSHGRLHFALDTLATKVVTCHSESGGSPVAYGVEIAPGAALAVASNFEGKQKLKTELITVRHEVIISAGVFQSPQLVGGFEMPVSCDSLNMFLAHGISILPILNMKSYIVAKLSGIGDQLELSKHGIDSVVHLPGVGTNLQGQELKFVCFN